MVWQWYIYGWQTKEPSRNQGCVRISPVLNTLEMSMRYIDHIGLSIGPHHTLSESAWNFSSFTERTIIINYACKYQTLSTKTSIS